MVPADVVNEAHVTVVDVREHLDHDEWEVALGLLADLDTGWRPPTAWCHRGRWESIHGIVRTELRVWVESAPALSPDTTGSVRLGPQSPALWRHLQPGMTITMHERRPTVGTATIVEASNAR